MQSSTVLCTMRKSTTCPVPNGVESHTFPCTRLSTFVPRRGEISHASSHRHTTTTRRTKHRRPPHPYSPHAFEPHSFMPTTSRTALPAIYQHNLPTRPKPSDKESIANRDGGGGRGVVGETGTARGQGRTGPGEETIRSGLSRE